MNSQLRADLNAVRIGFTDGFNGLLRSALTVGMLLCVFGESGCQWLRERCFRKEMA